MSFETEMLETADELISEHGVTVTIKRYDTGALNDSAKPWRGLADGSASDASAVMYIYPQERSSVFNDGGRYESGELIKQSDDKALLKGDAEQIKVGDRVIDGKAVYTVMQVKNFKSAGVSLLYDLWLRR